MKNNLVNLICKVFKNCKQYFTQMENIEHCEDVYNELLKIISRFKKRKYLLGTTKFNKRFESKDNVKINMISVDSQTFLNVCMMAVITGSKLKVRVKKKNNLACNELIRSLINKLFSYYIKDEFISYDFGFKEADYICKTINGKIYIGKDIKSLKVLNQQNFLLLK